MPVLLVSYDLTAPQRDYDNVIKAIKSHKGWAHPLESVWLVSAERTPVQLRDELTAVMDADDKILVVDVTNDPAAWKGLTTDVSNWIKSNL